jgi:hypothetical protein
VPAADVALQYTFGEHKACCEGQSRNRTRHFNERQTDIENIAVCHAEFVDRVGLVNLMGGKNWQTRTNRCVKQ